MHFSSFIRKAKTVALLLFWLYFALQGAATPSSGSEANANMSCGLDKRSSRSQLSSPSQNYYSDDDFDLYPPRGKRLAPVGAASNEDEASHAMTAYGDGSGLNLPQPQALTSDNNQLEERLRQMEEDQEELNSSLMSLTSHFAKVIFSIFFLFTSFSAV